MVYKKFENFADLTAWMLGHPCQAQSYVEK